MLLVNEGLLTQCPTCFLVMDAWGRYNVKADQLILGSNHVVCPRCMRRASDPKPITPGARKRKFTPPKKRSVR